MSSYFNQKEYVLGDLADLLEDIVNLNNDKSPDAFGYPIGRGYSPETIARLRETAQTLRRTKENLQRIGWLLSGEFTEDTLHARWNKKI